jgi:hypothetical protein
MATMEQINPTLLTWTRETVGFSLPVAAEKLDAKDTAKATAAEKLAAREHGQNASHAAPSRPNPATAKPCKGPPKFLLLQVRVRRAPPCASPPKAR